MLLYRPEYYLIRSAPERTACESDSRWHARVQAFADQKTAAVGAAELILAKVRDGATGTISLAFDGATTSFRDTCHVDH
jgi:replicative DNA helicase